MAISEATVQRIREVPILEVAERYLHDLKKESAHLYRARCIWHDDRDASLKVYTNTNTFYCFGCHAGSQGNNTIGFVMLAERCDFVKAVELIAQWKGITVEKNEEDERLQRRLDGLQKQHERFVKAFRECGEAQAYLESRVPDRRLWEWLDVGYVPRNEPYFLKNAHRLAIPLRDIYGRIRGWEFRAIDGSEPKSKVSPESDLFDKKEVVGGIHNIPTRSKQIILVEGSMDAAALKRVGVENVCWTVGSRLYEQQLSILLRRLDKSGEIILMYDGDQAGRAGIANADALLEEKNVPCRVVRLPEGMDPDDWVNHVKDPEKIKAAINQARPLIQLQLMHIFDGMEQEIASLRRSFANRVLQVGQRRYDEMQKVLKAHPHNSDLDFYRSWVARAIEDPFGVSVFEEFSSQFQRVAKREEGQLVGETGIA